MGPFQGFGPNWDQVPNLGHHYEHCSCYLDFLFPETKFSETETETFFRDQIFSKPKPRLFFRNQIFRNRNRNPQRFGKSFETEKFRNRNVNLWSRPLHQIGLTEKDAQRINLDTELTKVILSYSSLIVSPSTLCGLIWREIAQRLSRNCISTTLKLPHQAGTWVRQISLMNLDILPKEMAISVNEKVIVFNAQTRNLIEKLFLKQLYQPYDGMFLCCQK